MDETKHTVELFSGGKVFSHVAGSLGFATLTVDRDPNGQPDLVADIRSLAPSLLPQAPLVLWAAPPDALFNVADHEHHWDNYGTPLTPSAEEAMETFRAVLNLLTSIEPKWWFIENPYGPLRDFSLMAGFNRGYPSRNRVTIDHSDYGDLPPFRTDIWTNAFWWQPRREAVSRVARRPTNANVQAVTEAGRRLPAPAIAEMFDQLDAYGKRQPSDG